MSVSDLFCNIFGLGVSRLKFIGLGFVCLFACLYFRVNFVPVIQCIQRKASEFGLGEYLIYKGKISAYLYNKYLYKNYL